MNFPLVKRLQVDRWSGKMSQPAEDDRWGQHEELFAAIAHVVATPSPTWPTVRWWTKQAFDKLCHQVKERLPQGTQTPSNVELLAWMKRLGVAHEIEAGQTKFFLLEIGASAASEIDPLEILMAYEPRGVICYFSALTYYSLTSQIATHHHIALCSGPAKKADRMAPSKRPRERTAPTYKATQRRPPTLGRLLFTLEGAEFYLTRRKWHQVPGVQMRQNGPRCRLRMTTLEQTLIDTLFKPQNCGGPSVVLEAWQEAVASHRLNENKLADLLMTIDFAAISRRVGAMLQSQNYMPTGTLATYLKTVQQSIERNAPHAVISLMPGFDFPTLNDQWLVKTP